MAKMGRPVAENPRSYKTTIRLTKEEYDFLHNYAEENKKSITEVMLGLLTELKEKEDM